MGDPDDWSLSRRSAWRYDWSASDASVGIGSKDPTHINRASMRLNPSWRAARGSTWLKKASSSSRIFDSRTMREMRWKYAISSLVG